MNNRYDIEIPNFTKLEEDDVVVFTSDEINRPPFTVLVYPHYKSSAAEKYITVNVKRYTHYPHRVAGLVDNSLSFTVSIVDTDGRERFFRSFGTNHFFSMNWVVSLKLGDESVHEKLVSRTYLSDQSDELLKDDLLTIRIDASYQVSRPSLEECSTYKVVKSPKVVKESDIERQECVELMEESLCELREFIFLYKDLTQLHEMLGSDPDIERLVGLANKSENVVRFQGLFKDLSDCFRLHRSLQKQATGILPYTENMDEDEVKKVQKRIWKNRVNHHLDVVGALQDFLKVFMNPRRIVLDRETEWERKIELVEARMQLIIRLFHLNEQLKECFNNRKWLDKEAEEAIMEENRGWGDRNSSCCLKENTEQMNDQYLSLKAKSLESVSLLKEIVRFFIIFISTIELLTDHVFKISNIFFDWTQALIERNLPKDKPKTKQAPKDVDKGKQMTHSDYPISKLTIETESDEFVVSPVSKLLDSSPVFKQMVSHPFKEALEGKITIKVFDSVTVRDLLFFVDSGGSLREDMDRDECLSLYFMSHMYQVESLEERLADHLYSTLCSQSVGYVRKFSNRLGEDHCLSKVLDKFYENMKALDISGKRDDLDHEPEFKNGLKEWAREQRRMLEAEKSFNFYQ